MPGNSNVTAILSGILNILSSNLTFFCSLGFYTVAFYTGNIISKAFSSSPLLNFTGAVSSFIVMLFSMFLAWLFYLITGSYTLSDKTSKLLPMGNDRIFSLTIGFITIMLIVAYFILQAINRVNNQIIRLMLVVFSIFTSVYLSIQVFTLYSYEYIFVYCVAGLVFSFVLTSILRNN